MVHLITIRRSKKLNETINNRGVVEQYHASMPYMSDGRDITKRLNRQRKGWDKSFTRHYNLGTFNSTPYLKMAR